MSTREQVVIRFKVKAPISDTPRHADGQLGANPAGYQREPDSWERWRELPRKRDRPVRERGQEIGRRVQRGTGEKEKGEKEGP